MFCDFGSVVELRCGLSIAFTSCKRFYWSILLSLSFAITNMRRSPLSSRLD